MTCHPLVSIIIPCYNSSKYIRETINSCLSQTYKNIEIIVIDDGSKDGTYDVLSKIESNKLTVLRQPNSGACVARNFGLQKSTGDLIQYLDGDDLLSHDKIEKQIRLFNVYGDQYVYSCGYSIFKCDVNNSIVINQKVNKSYTNPAEWLNDSWSGGGFGLIMNWLTPRKLHDQAGKWNEKLVKNQDGEFFCRVLLKSKGTIFSETALVYWRRTGEISISTNHSYVSAQSVLYSFKLYEQHVNYLSPQLNRAIGKLYFSFILLYYRRYPVLAREAKNSIHRLGINYSDLTNSRTIRFSINLLGLTATLNLLWIYASISRVKSMLKVTREKNKN